MIGVLSIDPESSRHMDQTPAAPAQEPIKLRRLVVFTPLGGPSKPKTA
jgi:hypothetical protein